MRLRILGAAIAIAVTLWLSTAMATATDPGPPAVESRQDFAGGFWDGEAKVDVYLFVGAAEGAAEDLRAHYGDEQGFRIEPATYTLAELEAVRAAVDGRWAELEEAGLDLRELGIDVQENRVDIGVHHSLGLTREALVEYGDMVHVFWSEGGFIGPEPVRGTAVRSIDDVKVRVRLDDYPLVAGEPTWITTVVKNQGDTPIRYVTSTCDVPFGVRGVMVGESWRPGTPAEIEAIEAPARHSDDLRWRVHEGTYAGDATIHLGFAPKGALGPEEWGCGGDIARVHRLAPGGVVERRLRWDGGTIGSYPAGSFGPPPEGLARFTGSFDFRRAGSEGEQSVEVVLEVPVSGGRDPELLHPMEVVDAALADWAFAALLEPVDIGDRFGEVLFHDELRQVWVVGVCADYRTKIGRWKAAMVDPLTGEVRRILDRTTGRYCYEGPWR